MILTKSLAAAAVAWHRRTEIPERLRNLWERMLDNAMQIQTLALLLLSIMTVCVIGARVKLHNDQSAEAAQQMRIDLERQEAIRASMIASEQAKEQQALAAHKADCESVARVLYGTALHHSADAQKAVVWCIINRVESSLYPDTIQEVCSQESQWMGYSVENPVIESLYSIADEVLSGWEQGGYRAISPDYLFLTWTRDEIVLRTSYTEGRNTHYWRVS